MADMQADVLRFRLMIVEAVKLGQLHQYGPSVLHLNAQLGARSDHLLARDAVHVLSKCADKINAAARDDVDLETVFPQKPEKFDLRPVGALFEEPTELGMLCRRDPVVCDPIELLLR